MLCPYCHEEAGENSRFCSACGKNLTGEPVYAGFWKRFAAALIDGLILSVFSMAFVSVLYASMMPILFDIIMSNGEVRPEHLASLFIAFYLVMLFYLIFIVLTWLYYSLMESSKKQGTLGKMALGIVVTDLNGNRITFGRASGRYFAKMLSSMVFGIGYLLAAFTEKKQALHDMVAGCLVVRRK